MEKVIKKIVNSLDKDFKQNGERKLTNKELADILYELIKPDPLDGIF